MSRMLPIYTNTPWVIEQPTFHTFEHSHWPRSSATNLTTDNLPNHTPSFQIDMPCSHEVFQRSPNDTDWQLVAMAVDLSWKSCPPVQAIGRRRPSHIAGRQASLGTANYGLPYPPSLQSSDELECLARHLIANPLLSGWLSASQLPYLICLLFYARYGPHPNLLPLYTLAQSSPSTFSSSSLSAL